ncbi:hybrid sensor histidine kinase/response regulator, partial [bacterium]|nr:hybrid sensor histidine kinase/response regulator [bacterium]
MPALVLAFDQERNVIVWNQECERVTNFTADEMIGNPNVFRILFPDPLERENAFAVIFNAANNHRNVEVSLVNKERQFKTISWSNLSHLYPIASWSAWVVGIDVTESKQMEEERLRTRKLESVGLLAGGIAHDFNNLLTAVVGNVSLAKDKMDEKSYSYKRLMEAETASFRAKDLTLQLLTFAKGGTPVKKTEDMKSFVKETALFTLRGSNVRCEFEFDEHLFLVDVDSGQMSQVVQNLVINASHAMPEGGVIRIHLYNCRHEDRPSTLPSGDYVCMSIHDEGVGIQQQYLNKIFDPYFTTKEKGNGLG